MSIYLRDGKPFQYNEGQDHLLKTLYSSILGRCLLKVLTLPFITTIGGFYMNSSLSKRKISSFIKHNNIQMDDYIKEDYKNYNQFFTRKIKPGKRSIDQRDGVLIAPADSKISYYPIQEHTRVLIKNTYYTIEELLKNRSLANEYRNGTCLICRLTVDDYHRYHYIDSGISEKEVYIKGIFHTVNPIANDYYPIYKENSRAYTLLHTEHFEDVIYMEVGAMMVGKIVNHKKESFIKGEEKGYFEFGGSTIVLLFKENIVNVDQDIIEHSKNYDEVKVKLGEKIGQRQVRYEEEVK